MRMRLPSGQPRSDATRTTWPRSPSPATCPSILAKSSKVKRNTYLKRKKNKCVKINGKFGVFSGLKPGDNEYGCGQKDPVNECTETDGKPLCFCTKDLCNTAAWAATAGAHGLGMSSSVVGLSVLAVAALGSFYF